MADSSAPLIQRAGESPFAFHEGRPISVARFGADVAAAARGLAEASFVVNACADRYRFMVSFFAVAAAGRTNLLPPVRTAETLGHLAAAYPGLAVLTDECVQLHERADAVDPDPVWPQVPDDHLAAVAFTSGSTGAPLPHAKPWGALCTNAGLHAERLGAEAGARLVATVPPWHMYGLEWTMMLATRASVTVYCGESFYPGDLRQALAGDGRRILVTTPIHLRALLRSSVEQPRVDQVVCATAPLEQSLAEAAETQLSARVLEIYGCSEVGTLAHREPAREVRWHPFDGFELSLVDGVSRVRAPYLPEPVELADRIALADDGTFELQGRLGDLVKVAGKRASLSDLTARLLRVPGVEDGVIVDPAALGLPGGERLCALVVAPGAGAEEIRRRLAEVVDPAFLPRPLKLVDRLPRSATGKLPREALLALLQSGSAEG